MSDAATHARPAPFQGIDNFRDFGGVAAAGGRAVKRGRLYRSGHHGRATPLDLDALGALGLSAVVDLRRPDEREREPFRAPSGFRPEVIVNHMPGEDTYTPFLMTSDLSEAAMHAYLVDYYEHAPFEPRHIDLYRRYFARLASDDGGVLIHCAAGKDRTGILAALTHQLLGVAWDDTMADYLATNDPTRMAGRLPLFSDYVFQLTGRRATDAALMVTMGVAPEYLDTAFATIRARHGAIDSYLEDVLGVEAAKKAAIEDRLLA